MSRRGLMSLLTLVLLAAFAFAAPQQSSDKQTGSTPQGTKNIHTTKTDKHDHAMKDKAASDATQNMASSTLGSDDRKFIMEAAHGGMMEVKLGR